MSDTPPKLPGLEESLGRWTLGFFGTIVTFVLLPRTAKYVIRKVIVRLFLEVIAILAFGFLSDRLLTALGHLEIGKTASK